MQDLMRQGLAHTVHVLRAGVERIAAGARIVVGDAAARLDRDGGDAVVVERQSSDVLRPGKGGLDHIRIAQAHRERGVVGGALMNRRRAGPHRVLGADDCGQRLVIDRDQLCRVVRLRFGRGDHDGDLLADIAHMILRQRRALGAVALGAAHILWHRLGIKRAELICGPVCAGQDGKDTGHLLGGGFLDGADPRPGVQ